MNGTRVGYARGSTDEQDVIVQTEQLQALGVDPGRAYIDRRFLQHHAQQPGRSGPSAGCGVGRQRLHRHQVQPVRPNMAEASEILTDLSDRGVLFGLGGSVYDWKDPFGRLFLQTLATAAEFEANPTTCAPVRAWRSPSARAS